MTPKRRPLVAALICSVALFALASPLIKWLMTQGARDGLVQVDAISFCNVLFVGNLMASSGSLSFCSSQSTSATRSPPACGW